MDSGTLIADFINKYIQLTPWIQALIGLSVCSTVLGIAYLLKETVARPQRKLSFWFILSSNPFLWSSNTSEYSAVLEKVFPKTDPKKS